MKKALLLFLCVVGPVFADVAELNLGSRGQLTLYFPDGWKATSTEMGGQATLNVTAVAGDVNATCSVVVTFPESDRFSRPQRLKTQVEADGYALLQSGAVEGNGEAKEFYLAGGFGFYCSFVDPNLRGKPPIKGDYKVVSFGKIRLAPDVLVEVEILADSFTDQPYQQLLGAIEGMEYKR